MGHRRSEETLWRHGGSSEDWPPAFDGRAARWLDPPAPWAPTREAAVIACLRLPPDQMQIIEFATIAEAREADRALYTAPCGPGCRHQHVLVLTTAGGQLRVARGSHDTPPVPNDLAAALKSAGY
jgi:hypothetical protein